MVSFQCEGCGDIVKKPKCKIHQQRCHSPFTCIDCHQTFVGMTYQPHNQCMTESEKYEKGYKAPKNKQQKQPAQKQQQQQQQTEEHKTNTAQPDSIIAQLNKKKEENNAKRPLEDEDTPVVIAAENKKSKKNKKEKKSKPVSLSEWSVDKLDSEQDKQVLLALEYILKRDQTAHSVEVLRNKVIALILSHPQAANDIKEDDYKTKFDQVTGFSFNSKKNKIVFVAMKK